MQQDASLERGRIVLSFYGDDFTGSTDAMESLTINGLPTVLFLDVPSKEVLDRFPHIRCVGVAGNSRVMNPAQMEQELPAIFQQLRDLGSEYVHYKVCSTFDSSKEIGNIATVLRISRDTFAGQPWVPVFVASPELGRYTVFGNHYAAMRGEVYRLDRHPTMSRHPITPMHEADLRAVLQEQGAGDVGLIDVLDLAQPRTELMAAAERKTANAPAAVVFDALTREHVEQVGAVLAASRQAEEPLFLIGSSGVGHAISSIQRSPTTSPVIGQERPGPKRVNQLLVVSGSCSPVTQQQLQWAMTHGFEGIHLSLQEVMNADDSDAALQHIVGRASEMIRNGKSLIIYTALGPDDPSIKENQRQISERGLQISDSSKILGSYLGEVSRLVIQETGIERLVISGGDTSSYATRQLGIYAMEMITSISPGAPLCRCYSDDGCVDGLELALKGGQFGGEDYFTQVLHMS
ncbi:four-carbon acid sugar kinase family protein [Alicyclobacillus fastidiosus]|uniref:Four-carbon acid sugar kinase family protein n=1 Tax=Alicyclobacillus fastidiosus TaxID=392011 RepID=A0ABV5AED7_9BACL|nr:four-carbon acid sugar kinase family protein [Alicyclobacillus fastidiosus]WEH09788.1 four-carbon acid sugar kinase family protein [Alicyclobacillus fastidiosus]